ncbi:hypothetical protein ACFOY8_12285 [Thalassospira xianhensis]|uniref:Uncharacterized protein n=1 Tax=Thalassospira xianhensis MCCC 1A02616 TaxID=1177929 RepID=A0A367UDF8_9PROT|nr:hypothetical protein [Thalassospira xianhensis]RCK06357.1 hypothetical protein TH5_09160 [Thalassospira xianhensis MCCC 1A02616]
MTILFEGEISDGRVTEGKTDDLTETQKKPWPMMVNATMVNEGGLGGLMMWFDAPDGTSRSVAIEIDQGNIKMVVFRDSMECDAIVTVQTDGVHVRANHGSAASYLFNEHGVSAASSAPTPSYSEDDATPTPR